MGYHGSWQRTFKLNMYVGHPDDTGPAKHSGHLCAGRARLVLSKLPRQRLNQAAHAFVESDHDRVRQRLIAGLEHDAQVEFLLRRIVPDLDTGDTTLGIEFTRDECLNLPVRAQMEPG